MESLRSTMQKGRAYFADWTAFEKGWAVTFALIAVTATYYTDGSLLALVAAFTGMATVILAAKGRIATYYVGAVNSALYAYIAFQSEFYGEVMLNGMFFLPMQFVGLYMWNQNTLENTIDTVKADRLPNRRRVGWLFLSVIAVAGYSVFLRWLGGNLPLVDAVSTVLSVVAMVLMVRRVMEQWLAWITVNVVSIYMWANIYSAETGSSAMVVMWTAYLVNSIYGYYNWLQMSDSPTTTSRETVTAAGGDDD
jgi:nicotinamide mononucleotide transporter